MSHAFVFFYEVVASSDAFFCEREGGRERQGGVGCDGVTVFFDDV